MNDAKPSHFIAQSYNGQPIEAIRELFDGTTQLAAWKMERDRPNRWLE